VEHVRPVLIRGPERATRKGKEKEEPRSLVQPLTLWINKLGRPMEMDTFTVQLEACTRKFSPTLSVNAVNYRRMAVTDIFSGRVPHEGTDDDLVSRAAEYLT